VRRALLPQIAAFAKQQQVTAIWVVLQGQTMVRLARPLALRLGLPLRTQVWDPFGWWLRANSIDRHTQRRLLAAFDAAIQQSTACATASWAMAEAYASKYGGQHQPVIAGLPRELALAPAQHVHAGDDFIIAMAGQFYAQTEWDCLIHTLNGVQWRIAGRRVRVRVMGGGLKVFTQHPANFEYLGWQSQSETIRLLAEADLLYMPYWFSEEFREEASQSFPSKLVTYFAAGRPVLCHAPEYASPTRYLKQHAAGYVCESLDPPALLKQLEYVIADQAQYRAMAANGTACFMRDFTLERMQTTFAQFLERQADTSKGAGQ
jgi:glycosyltransferase involved in cell wall biosynthesis